MTGPTNSGKLNALVVRAEAVGLVVGVEAGDSTGVIESWTVRIRRPEIGDPNALAHYYDNQFLSIHALRIRGQAAAFKLNIRQYGVNEPRTIKPKTLPYVIDSYAEDYRRYTDKYKDAS